MPSANSLGHQLRNLEAALFNIEEQQPTLGVTLGGSTSDLSPSTTAPMNGEKRAGEEYEKGDGQDRPLLRKSSARIDPQVSKDVLGSRTEDLRVAQTSAPHCWPTRASAALHTGQALDLGLCGLQKLLGERL